MIDRFAILDGNLSITNHIFSSIHCFQFFNVLFVQVWKTFDQKITDAANEAKDNVKILYSLLTYCQPLYYSDPVSIKPEIKKMMEAIRIIYTTSQHYNTTDCMTHLFVKVCLSSSKNNSITRTFQLYKLITRLEQGSCISRRLGI